MRIKFNKLLSILFALVMLVSLLPTVVLAEGVECSGGDVCTHQAAIGSIHYDTLANAIATVGTETTTIVLQDDVELTEGLTIPSDKQIVLELNGKTISGNTNSSTKYAVITNLGTLTIQDSTDTNKDGTGVGLITSYIGNPDTGAVPGYASNTITNHGILTVKSGKIVNNGQGYACFAIDNQTNSNLYTPVLNIEGGRMVQNNEYTYAVRMFCNGSSNANTVNISGGVIEGGYGLWLHIPNGSANKAGLTISGGTLNARDGFAFYAGGMGTGNNDYTNVSIEIRGGTINGSGAAIQGAKTDCGFRGLSVSGGTFVNFMAGVNISPFISGGTFGTSPDDALLVNGYEWVQDGDGYKVRRAVTGITIKTAPTKIRYVAGQSFDDTGMVLEATYNDNSKEDITSGWTVDKTGALDTTDTFVTITYEGRTAMQSITVVPKAVTGITIKTAPTKIRYVAGQSFDDTGMVLEVTYNDNSKEDITTGWTVDKTGALAKTDTFVTITYEGRTATQSITVRSGGHTGGGGSGYVAPTYSIGTAKTENGSVSVFSKAASKGTAVTITVTSDEGYELDSLTVLDKDGKEIKLTEKNGRYTFEMPASDITVKASFKKIEEVNPFFVDVKAGDYFYNAVLWAVEKDITSGTSDTTFSPNDPCTRAQIVTLLWRAAGSPEPNGTASFVDVNADSYYAKAVSWAVEKGITVGTSDTTFSPEDVCTRAQAVTFLSRVLNGKATVGSSFSDVAADSYYAEAVSWAVEKGITVGTSDTTFSPDDVCTRGQIVTFLFRAMAE